jgi:hypothetical protein
MERGTRAIRRSIGEKQDGAFRTPSKAAKKASTLVTDRGRIVRHIITLLTRKGGGEGMCADPTPTAGF